jgi:hypothetical protein
MKGKRDRSLTGVWLREAGIIAESGYVVRIVHYVVRNRHQVVVLARDDLRQTRRSSSNYNVTMATDGQRLERT